MLCASRAAILPAMERTSSTGELERAQAALLARYAPETRVRRLRWSQGETQVLELGAGAPLLYVHGGLSGACEIVPILGALARNHRVLAVDRPGHGLADPFDYRGVDVFDHARTFLREVLDGLELATVDVVANSMGAHWSVVCALDAPDRISRLALVGAPFGLRQRVPRQLLMLALPLIGQRVGRHFFSNATRAGSRKFWGQVLVSNPSRLDDLLLDFDVANSRRNVESMLSLVECIADIRHLGVRSQVMLGERWRALTTSTLLLWGTHDAFGGPALGEAVVATNPHVRLVRIADAGHLPWLDDPASVVSEVERFLSAEPRSGGVVGNDHFAGSRSW